MKWIQRSPMSALWVATALLTQGRGSSADAGYDVRPETAPMIEMRDGIELATDLSANT
jgi:hypothetical protein